MILVFLGLIIIILIAINKNLVELRKESKKWLTEIAENVILSKDNN